MTAALYFLPAGVCSRSTQADRLKYSFKLSVGTSSFIHAQLVCDGCRRRGKREFPFKLLVGVS